MNEQKKALIFAINAFLYSGKMERIIYSVSGAS